MGRPGGAKTGSALSLRFATARVLAGNGFRGVLQIGKRLIQGGFDSDCIGLADSQQGEDELEVRDDEFDLFHGMRC